MHWKNLTRRNPKHRAANSYHRYQLEMSDFRKRLEICLAGSWHTY